MNAPPSDPEYLLRGVAGAVFGRSYHLLAPTTVGRSAECDICLPGSGLSRVHARLRPLDYGIEIEDLTSTNGSFINGHRITTAIARAGDEIAFDDLRFRISAINPTPRPAIQPRHANGQRSRWIWAVLAVVMTAGAVAVFATGWLAN
ncbi:FHA domain-containing protein [Lysobacter fragariae]